MRGNLRSDLVRRLALGLIMAAAPAVVSAQDKPAPPPPAVNVTVTAATAAAPQASITLQERHGHVTPCKGKLTHSGGGLIDVASPSADVVVVTMTGAIVANGEMRFDLDQCFEISFDDPKLKKAKLSVEGRVIGLLRGEPKGCAEYADACAHISGGPAELISLCVPPHNACGCESLAVNDHDGPRTIPVAPGKYTLQQTFCIRAHSTCFLMKHPSAEFAPDPALDPLWISYFDPFHGVKKDQFGFQVTLKVIPDTDPAPAPAPAPAK
jgi:hypothetical protein